MKKEDIKLDFQLYKKEIDEIKRELKTLPEGYLAKKGSSYFETIGTTQKGITKNRQKLRQLARKGYLQHRLKNLEWNYTLLEKQIQRLKTEVLEEIIQGMPPAYQALPLDYFFHPSVQSQMEGVYEDKNVSKRNTNFPEGLLYLTDSGIYVRSKSERTIANALYQHKIPYRYETAITLGGTIRYPDFTIFRPSDGKLFLWEHLGLMDSSEYKQKVIEKSALYSQHGFFAYDNLIYTYERDLQNPVNLKRIIELHFSG